MRSLDQAAGSAERDIFGAENHFDSLHNRVRGRSWRPQTLLAIERDEPLAPTAFDDVSRAEESGDELRLRVVVDLVGRAELFQPPAVENGDLIPHLHRLFL